MYRLATEAHPACTVIKSEQAAEDCRSLVALNIKFMLGCDLVWAAEGPAPAAAAGPAMAALPAASAEDDACPPSPPPVDPNDFTKWNPADVLSLSPPSQVP